MSKTTATKARGKLDAARNRLALLRNAIEIQRGINEQGRIALAAMERECTDAAEDYLRLEKGAKP